MQEIGQRGVWQCAASDDFDTEKGALKVPFSSCINRELSKAIQDVPGSPGKPAGYSVPEGIQRALGDGRGAFPQEPVLRGAVYISEPRAGE